MVRGIESLGTHNSSTGEVIHLPPPKKITEMSVEESILHRRSVREFAVDPLKFEHFSMILWSAFGITEPRQELRASPSAGATYPMEVYVVVGEKSVEIKGGLYLEAGVYKYDPFTHSIKLMKKGDFRRDLASAALGQQWVEEAPINIVICAVFERTTRVYGKRGEIRYVPMEVGHAGQSIYLMSTALGYGTVAVGAFYDEQVARVVSVARDEVPLYIMPVGVPKRPYRGSFEELEKYLEANRRG
ncbi:MAG: SagB/ThcOx family dehydrogenase [Thermofilaceae archaeon]